MADKTILYAYNISDKKLIKNGQAKVFHEAGKYRLVSTKHGVALCGVIDIEQSVILMLLAEEPRYSAKEKKEHFARQLNELLETEEKSRIGSYYINRAKLDFLLETAMQYKEEIPVQLTIDDFLQHQEKQKVGG